MTPKSLARAAAAVALLGLGSATGADAQSAAAKASGVFVDQIGEGGRATIAQRRGSPQSFARIVQRGYGNAAGIEQDASSAYADIGQTGDDNGASILQRGEDHSTASIAQAGTGNQASISQTAGLLGHTALVRQTGDRNTIGLTQTGGDNSAILTQEGDDNRMTVDQFGSNNALTWTQEGNSHPDLLISMEGERAMTITQSNIGRP